MKLYKSKLFRLAALTVAMSQVLSIPTITSFADEGQENVMANDMVEQTVNEMTEERIFTQPIENEIAAEDFIVTEEEITPAYELKPILEGNKYEAKEIISIRFDKANVKSYSYVADGVTVIEKSPNSMQFDIIPTAEVGSIDVYADYGTGEPIKSSVYTYLNEGQIYISDVSKDQAWYDCMEEKYNDGLITMEQWEDSYSEYTRKYFWADVSEEITTASEELEQEEATLAVTSTSSGNTTVSGRIFWRLKDGTSLPLKNTRIELRDDEPLFSDVLKEGYTDENGEYSFTFGNDDLSILENGGYDPFIRVYTESRTIKVASDWVFFFNYGDTDVIDDIATGANVRLADYYIAYDETNNANKAVYVQQAMVLGERFAMEMGMDTDYFLNVVYPATEPFPADKGFCWGDLAEDCYALIGTSKFNRFDLCLHEYGHFVEIAMGNYGASWYDMLVNNPNHIVGNDQFVDKTDKEYAMQLVWSESWAYAFAQIAQDYYATEYGDVPYVADHYDQDLGWDFETPVASSWAPISNRGEANEISVFSTLWDLYDGLSEEHDNVALGFQAWWDYTTRVGTATLTDFMTVIDTYYKNRRFDIGELMSYHQISPESSISNKSAVSATVAPIVRWKVNGSLNHPNNRFNIVVYNESGTLLYQSGNISSALSYNSYMSEAIESDDWEDLVQDYGDSTMLYIGVVGWRSDSPISGPYLSNCNIIDFEREGSFTVSRRYLEQIIDLGAGESYDYNVTFTFANNMIVQTFGRKDTVIQIYDNQDTLVASNDDNGYDWNGFIKFWANASQYKIRVRLFASGATGRIKLTITCAGGATESGVSDLTDYDYIKTITTNASTFTWSTYAYKNSARVIRYVQQTSGYYTFTIESNFDTYMYVIDPRSNVGIVRYIDHDNNSRDGWNPSLTRYIEAGVPYYIVYSAANPGALTETKSLKVVMKRN